jgi:hypothetical protein
MWWEVGEIFAKRVRSSKKDEFEVTKESGIITIKLSGRNSLVVSQILFEILRHTFESDKLLQPIL